MSGRIDKATVTFEGAPLSRLRPVDIATLTSRANGISNTIKDRLAKCLLGILGAEDAMNQSHDLAKQHPDFKVTAEKDRQTIRLNLENAPANAFVNGELTSIRRRHVAAAFRDLAFQAGHLREAFDASSRSELVEKMIADAGLLNRHEFRMQQELRNAYQVVFQGGHTIGSAEYKYSKLVGEEFGLRGWEGISGGGPGTMRGTLRGNQKGFHQQLIDNSRQMGFSAPEIIAVEPPNVWVTDLAILHDIEMRLEAFARKMHAIVFLPGGIGTLEELLIQLGTRLDARNSDQSWPIVVTAHSPEFPQDIQEFIAATLGEEAAKTFHTIVNSPRGVAEFVDEQRPEIDLARDVNDEAHEWNRSLVIPQEFQKPFIPTHENMAALELTTSQPVGTLAAQLRMLCKGLVHGSITVEGMRQIEEHGKFQIHGDRNILEALDRLLQKFIAQKRIKADFKEPCYEFVAPN